MQAEELKRYLANKVQMIQDEEVLLAIKTIIDKHLDSFANPYKGAAPKDTPQSQPVVTANLEGTEPLQEGVEEEEIEQEIENWLKKI